MGQLFSFLTNFVSITGDFWTDFIWVGIIGVISFASGWIITGDIAEDLGYSRVLMSIAHWTIRIVTFAILVGASKGVYYLTQL